MISAARWATATTVACTLPFGTVGRTEASATRRRSTPRTYKKESEWQQARRRLDMGSDRGSQEGLGRGGQ